MPPWQLVPKPLHHTLTWQNCSQTEQPWESDRQLWTRQVSLGDEGVIHKQEVSMSDRKTLTPKGACLAEGPCLLSGVPFLHLGNEQLGPPVISGTQWRISRISH